MSSEAPVTAPPQPAVVEQEFQYLAEDAKINRIMDMLKSLHFGDLTIKKHKGKIAGFIFSGEVKYRLSEYDKTRKDGQR